MQGLGMRTSVGQDSNHGGRESPEERPRPFQPHDLANSVCDTGVRPLRAYCQPCLDHLHRVYEALGTREICQSS